MAEDNNNPLTKLLTSFFSVPEHIDHNQLFILFVRWILTLIILFGTGATIVALWGDKNLALRMLNIFAAMWSGLLGLGAGYLLGARNGKKNGNGSQ